MGVFRFSNAVSDISKFIDTYKSLYVDLKDHNDFTHDDATESLISKGLVSSSGAIGKEAMKRSRREDRSRDPLYNQLKMYSEIYRMLGWYRPGSQRTKFNIPEYGEYIKEATGDLLSKHFELNTLHIVSPNPLVEIKGENILRPFPLILKILKGLGGYIHRDEIILTVLACENDRNENTALKAITCIEKIRAEDSLEEEYQALMEKNGVGSSDTFRNYTRYIMASLKHLKIALPTSVRDIYGDRTVRFYKQTEYGKELTNYLDKVIDIRHSDIESYSLETRGAFTLFSVYHQLGKIGYNLETPEINQILQKALKICKPLLKDFNILDGDFLYFGYQESNDEEIEKAKEIFEHD